MIMLKKLVITILFTSLLGLIFASDISAKKVLPRFRATGKTTNVTSSRGGITTSVKFRADRRAIIVNFSNLGVANSVSYTLSYNSRGTTQGAAGTLDPSISPDPTTRELLFGTCSHGVCRYDSGITNARFVVTTMTTGGKRVIKSFRLKV
jgi:hypothetical protein